MHFLRSSSRYCSGLLLLALTTHLRAAPKGEATITRGEVLAIARSYAELTWQATPANVRHGKDADGVEVSTPNAATASEVPPGYWIVNATNTGMPYKWGGFDTLDSFRTGVQAGKAAGDLYNSEKRRLSDAAVSTQAVGLDCSGFISRCWKLPKKYGTANLPQLCTPLASTDDLKPGDILNAAGGHVILFAAWIDATHDQARFYESEPYSKVLASVHSTRELTAAGFKAWRYRRIKE